MKELVNRLSANKGQQILFISTILFVFVTIYILNRIFPLYLDDWDYIYLWIPGGGDTHRVSSFSDIAISQYNHYMHWGGRSVVHAIDQFLLMIGTGWHDLLNTLAYVFLTLLIYGISNKQNKINGVIYLLIVLACWLCLPAFTSSVFWITHSANYLWGNLIILAFIYPFYSYYRTEKVNEGAIRTTFMFLAGIIAGWTNENMAIALISFLVMLILLLKYKRTKIPLWVWLGFLGVIIGCITMFAAPGNYLRLASSDNIGYIKRLTSMIQHYLHYLLLLSVIYLAILIFFVKTTRLKDKPKIVFGSLLFFISAHIGFAIMIGSPQFPSRVLFGVVAFIITGMGILYSNINIEHSKIKVFNLFLITAMFIFFCIDYIEKYRMITYVNDFWHRRELFIEEQKQKGVIDIVFTEKMIYHDDCIVYELEEDSDSWVNNRYARYYGVRSVRRISINEHK